MIMVKIELEDNYMQFVRSILIKKFEIAIIEEQEWLEYHQDDIGNGQAGGHKIKNNA